MNPKYGELDAHRDLKLVVKGEVDDSGDRRLKSLYVEGIFHRYLELRECKPRLSKLRSILGENLFAGMSSIEAAAGPTTRQLLDRVQCSEKELQQGLPFGFSLTKKLGTTTLTLMAPQKKSLAKK